MNDENKSSGMLATIFRRVNLVLAPVNTLRGNLVRGGFGTIAVKLASALVNLLVAVLLARFLAPAGLGIYAFALACISVLAIPAQFGLPTLVIRETAKAQADNNYGLVYGLWRWANRAVYLLSLLLVTLAAVYIASIFASISSVEIVTFGFGLLLVPLIALGKLRGAALVGLRHMVTGQIPDLLVRPLVLAILLIVILPNHPFPLMSPAVAMGLHAVAAALALTFASVSLRRVNPPMTRPTAILSIPAKRWTRAAIPLGLLAGVQMLIQHTDVVMLGLMKLPSDVGIYRVVLATSAIIAFGLSVVNLVIAPHIARLHAQEDRSTLRRVARWGARISLLIAFPCAALIMFFGEEVLMFVFGETYIAGAKSLRILAVGQLLSAAAGSAGIVLNMTGHEKETLKGVGIAAALNVVLNALLIPVYGIDGAAASTTISLLVWNVLLWRGAYKHAGVNCSAFSFPLR